MNDKKDSVISDPVVFNVKIPSLVLSLIASVIIGWAVSCFSCADNEWLSGIACAIVVAITLSVSAAASTARIGIMIKTVSIIFFICGLVMNIILAIFDIGIKVYTITDGLLLTIFSIVIYMLYTRELT